MQLIRFNGGFGQRRSGVRIEAVENLQSKRREAEKKLDEGREAREGAWEDIKAEKEFESDTTDN